MMSPPRHHRHRWVRHAARIFSSKRHTAVPATAGGYMNFGFVNKHVSERETG